FWDGKPAIFGVTKDISKVRLSEEKFSKLFHLNPSACGLSDLDNRQYIEVNEAFNTLLGFDKNEVIGKTATDLGILTPETINAIILKADSHGNVTNAETDLIAKNGDIKQVLISSENINVQNKIYRFTVAHDITARRKIENQLKESEYLQRSLLENVAVGIMIIDPETRVIERINTFALSLIGESAENIIGRRCHQFICPAQEQSCPVCDKGQDVDNSERVLLRVDNTAIPILKTVKWILIGGKEKLLESFVDISIQKKAEENLLKSSQKFEAIISASPDGIGMVSLDGKIQLMSKKLATMYGYSIEEIAELLGKEIFGFIDLSNHKMLMGNMNKLLTGEKGNKVTEYLAVKKDNSRFYVDINSTLLLDSNGHPENILFVERDITERKLSEEALFKSEQKFRTVADNTYDWEYWEGKDKQIIYISPSCERITGYKPEEFLSNRFLLKRIIHPADAKLFDDHFEKTHSLEHIRDIEELDFRIIKKDGSVIHIGHLCRPVFDDKDNCLGRRISNRDITERKKAEEILRKSEDQIKQLLQTTDQGIYGIDLNGCCTFINTSALKILDYQIEDCIGKNMHDLIHHSYSNGLPYPVKDCPIFRSKLSGESCRLDSEGLWRRNGTYFPAEYSSFPIFENGQIHGAVVTFSDITNRKQAELEIKLKNEELYTANSEKDKFFSIIAHDMRSPFNAFLGFTRIMVEDLDTMTLEELRKIVVSMRKSATNLYSLLENLL
ncbi:MAG: PAS domain S-box protein, partial [Bacteroidota bacterium]